MHQGKYFVVINGERVDFSISSNYELMADGYDIENEKIAHSLGALSPVTAFLLVLDRLLKKRPEEMGRWLRELNIPWDREGVINNPLVMFRELEGMDIEQLLYLVSPDSYSPEAFELLSSSRNEKIANFARKNVNKIWWKYNYEREIDLSHDKILIQCDKGIFHVRDLDLENETIAWKLSGVLEPKTAFGLALARLQKENSSEVEDWLNKCAKAGYLGSSNPLSLLKETCKNLEKKGRLLTGYDAFPLEAQWLCYQTGDYVYKAGLAKSNSTHEEIINKLAHDPNSNIRWDVAKRKNLPIKIILHFAHDPYTQIRQNMAEKYHHLKEVTEILKNDPHEHVRKTIANKADISMIADMVDDPRVYIGRIVRRRLEKEIMKEFRLGEDGEIRVSLLNGVVSLEYDFKRAKNEKRKDYFLALLVSRLVNDKNRNLVKWLFETQTKKFSPNNEIHIMSTLISMPSKQALDKQIEELKSANLLPKEAEMLQGLVGREMADVNYLRSEEVGLA